MKIKRKKIIIITFAAAILILLAVYLGMAFYFNSHFFFGSSINGIDSSRKTVEDVEDAVRNEVKSYVLQIDGRNELTDIITADDIDYEYVSDGSVSDLLKQQNPFAWIGSLFSNNSNDMQVTTSYDKQKLADKVKSLVFFQEENIKAPTDASVEYNDASGKYEIIPEDNGSTINTDDFDKALQKAIESGDTYLNIEDADCYSNAQYTSKSTELTELMNTLNKYINVTITYEFGDKYEICDKTYIQDWLEVADDFTVTFDLEKVRSYIDSIARIYNTWGKTRDFVNHDGKVIEVSGGDYGWLMDRSTETTRLVDLIKAGENVQVEPTYSQTARSRDTNDIGDSYIEIDLTLQHVWVYKDGKLVIDTDCVTGNSSRNYDTPTGIYQITYKERGATLVGENYSSDVEYWMPFWYNVGLHDASWRSSFGGKIYKTSGSHGCVNLPPSAAKTIFENIEKGTPVVCYASKEEETTSKDISKKEEVADSKTDSESKNNSHTETSASPKPAEDEEDKTASED